MRLFAAVLASIALVGCCFDALAPIATPPAPPPVAVATGGPHMPGGPGSAMFGRITLAPGFLPDPIIAAGIAGGPTMLSSFGSNCLGHAGPMPGHHLTIEGDTVLRLRIMAYVPGGQDLTIAVRRPEGTLICNDDSDGLSPMIEDTFGPGEYDVWVGTYGAGVAGVPYDLGVTTNLSVTPTVLHSPTSIPSPPPPLPVPVPISPPVHPVTGLPLSLPPG